MRGCPSIQQYSRSSTIQYYRGRFRDMCPLQVSWCVVYALLCVCVCLMSFVWDTLMHRSIAWYVNSTGVVCSAAMVLLLIDFYE